MKVTKRWAASWVVLILLFAFVMFVDAQSSTVDQRLPQETQALGYWVDPSTGLMWAGKDNGDKELNWHQAMKYCKNLQLAGYSDWRLANVDELQDIYDKDANSPGMNPKSHSHDAEAMNFHVKGGLFLSGNQWSSSRSLDDRQKSSGYGWRFDFNEGRAFGGDELWFNTDKHALCVRESRIAPAPPSNSGEQVWIDPATGLMWTARDNAKDVNLGEALKYCRDMRTAGYSGWRLATIDELEAIRRSNTEGPKSAGKQDDRSFAYRLPEELSMTGDPWSSSPVIEDERYPPRFVWYLNENTGTHIYDDPSFSHAKRALCVRNAAAQHALPTGPLGFNGKPSSGGQGSEQETQRLGYWIDPSTGLMWAGRDNLGKLIRYSEATSYCRNLRLARYSDWRLATIEELQGIYDPAGEAPGENPRSDRRQPETLFFHVKGNLFLTGMQWGNTSKNDGGDPYAYVWVFDLRGGRPVNDKGYAISDKRALCVRRP